MQDNPQAMPHWVFQVLQWLAAFGAGGLIVKLIILYQNRNKPAAEVHKTSAEANEISVRSSTNASDAVIRMIDKLDDTLLTIDRVRTERDDLRRQCDELMRDHDLCEIRSRHHEAQERRMMAIMEIHGIRYSEGDELPKPKDSKDP